jgi:hypothetical protein
MSNVPIEIDQDALREYLEGLPVFGEGSQTFGDVQRQFDEMERLGIIPAGQTTGRFPDGGSTDGVRVTPRDTTGGRPPEDLGETLFMPRIREDDGGGESDEDTRARLDREQRQAQFEASQAARRENAFGIISAFLQRAGLGGLETNIRGLLAQGIEDSDAILFNLRETTQFKTRFKANSARAAKGLPELDPATYIGLEQQYASVMRSNRLPSGFYDEQDDFRALIEGDVSPQSSSKESRRFR